jgi:hypothetical protein
MLIAWVVILVIFIVEFPVSARSEYSETRLRPRLADHEALARIERAAGIAASRGNCLGRHSRGHQYRHSPCGSTACHAAVSSLYTASARTRPPAAESISNKKRRRTGMLTRIFVFSITTAACVLAQPAALAAQTADAAAGFPSRPIRIVVGFTPGGQPDIIARVIAVKLTEKFGQQVVIDNRPGAGGTLGTRIVAEATPDGHTLLSVSSSHAISQHAFHRSPFREPCVTGLLRHRAPRNDKHNLFSSLLLITSSHHPFSSLFLITPCPSSSLRAPPSAKADA